MFYKIAYDDMTFTYRKKENAVREAKKTIKDYLEDQRYQTLDDFCDGMCTKEQCTRCKERIENANFYCSELLLGFGIFPSEFEDDDEEED